MGIFPFSMVCGILQLKNALRFPALRVSSVSCVSPVPDVTDAETMKT